MSTQTTAPTQTTREQAVESPTNEESESPATTEREEDLPFDVIFDMLSVERRRQVLDYLLDGTETTTLGDLAEHIAAIENDKPEAALSSKERKRVYVGLYQCHLPRMADAGIIDYDSDRGTVELGPNAEFVASHMPADDASDDDPRLSTPALASALAGVALFVGQGVLYPHALLAGFSIGVFGSSICLAALAHARSDGVMPVRPGFLDSSE